MAIYIKSGTIQMAYVPLNIELMAEEAKIRLQLFILDSILSSCADLYSPTCFQELTSERAQVNARLVALTLEN